MKLSQLIAKARLRLGDQQAPYLFIDENIIDALNDADREACIRGRLVKRNDLEVSLSAGDPLGDYPVEAWSITRTAIDGRKLEHVDRAMLDASQGLNWESATGTPRAVYEVDGKLRFYPIPEVACTAICEGYCKPSKPMSRDGDLPLADEIYHEALVSGAVAELYLNDDADGFSSGKASKHEAVFVQTFGEPLSADQMRSARLVIVHRTRSHFF